MWCMIFKFKRFFRVRQPTGNWKVTGSCSICGPPRQNDAGWWFLVCVCACAVNLVCVHSVHYGDELSTVHFSVLQMRKMGHLKVGQLAPSLAASKWDL